MTTTEIEALSRVFVLLLLGIFVRSSILAAISGLLILFFRSQSPEIRHFIWRGVLYGMLLLPILQLAIPPVHHTSQVLTKAAMAFVPAPLLGGINQGKTLAALSTTNLNRTQPPFPWIVIASAAYLLLAFGLLVRLGFNLLYFKRIIRRSEPVTGCDLPELGHAISLQSPSGLPSRIRVSADVCVPAAVGIHQISILLPASWRLWQRDKLQAVLVHEMAHVRRKDPATAFLASLSVCLFWFHPLAYWLRRQLAALSEEACDQTVLYHVSPERYSQILIEFASDMAKSGNRLTAASTVSARRSSLRKRLERILSASPCPGTRYRPIRLLLVTAFLPVLYLTAAARFDQAPAPNGTLAVDNISIGSQQQADQIESSLRQNPGNLAQRGSLMSFYANQGHEIKFTRHLVWVIDHHPEASLAGMRVYASAKSRQSATPSPKDSLAARARASQDQALVKAAWERSLSKHASSPEVLYHAGLYFERQDSQRALALSTVPSLSPNHNPACSRNVLTPLLLFMARP